MHRSKSLYTPGSARAGCGLYQRDEEPDESRRDAEQFEEEDEGRREALPFSLGQQYQESKEKEEEESGELEIQTRLNDLLMETR